MAGRLFGGRSAGVFEEVCAVCVDAGLDGRGEDDGGIVQGLLFEVVDHSRVKALRPLGDARVGDEMCEGGSVVGHEAVDRRVLGDVAKDIQEAVDLEVGTPDTLV